MLFLAFCSRLLLFAVIPTVVILSLHTDRAPFFGWDKNWTLCRSETPVLLRITGIPAPIAHAGLSPLLLFTNNDRKYVLLINRVFDHLD